MIRLRLFLLALAVLSAPRLTAGSPGDGATPGSCSLANEGDIPPPSHRLHSLHSAALGFWRVPGTVARKRSALRHALLKGNHAAGHHYEGKEPEVYDAAGAVATQIMSAGQHMPCRWDLSLPKGLPADMKYMIAVNLRNNEDLMPHYIRQLLIAVIGDAATENAEGHVLVSIYESGSSDDTPKFLPILEVLLLALGIPHAITANGHLTRNELERIAFLAQVRNAALAPLVHHKHYPDGFPAERIVFINDVWFCGQNIVRLSQYKSADMACAMDFMDLFSEPNPYAFYDYWVARDIGGNRLKEFFPVMQHNASIEALKEGWPFPMSCCWNGLVVLNAEPFRKHGLVFRAQVEDECLASECQLLCDDLARLGYPRFLMDPSVRMTYAPWDLHRLFGDLMGAKVPWRDWASLVDFHLSRGYATGGQASHESPGHVQASKKLLRGRPLLSQEPVAAAEGQHAPVSRQHPPVSYTGDVVSNFWRESPLPELRECCPKDPVTDWIWWDKCEWQNIMAPNYTDTFFKRTANSGGLRAALDLVKAGTC